MTKRTQPERIADDDLDAAGGGPATSHRQQLPVSFTYRAGKTGSDEADSFSSSAGGSPNI